jgi:hypothetical protein
VAIRDLPRLIRALRSPEYHRRRLVSKRERLREHLRRGVQPFLEPGESIEQVFQAQWPSPNLFPLEKFVRQYLVVAVTDRAILVVADSKRVGYPWRVQARIPRQTPLGPLWNGRRWFPVDLPGKRIWVERNFYEDVQAADAAIAPTRPAAPGSPTCW